MQAGPSRLLICSLSGTSRSCRITAAAPSRWDRGNASSRSPPQSRFSPSLRAPLPLSRIHAGTSAISYPSLISRSFSTSPHRRTPPPTTSSPAPSNKALNPDAVSKTVTEKSQALTDWAIIKRLAVNIWPKEGFSTKVRVVGALGLLVGAKVLNVQVPFFFKDIVDSLNVDITSDTTVWVLAGAAIAGCEWTYLLRG